jgi:hypothetical protein
MSSNENTPVASNIGGAQNAEASEGAGGDIGRAPMTPEQIAALAREAGVHPMGWLVRGGGHEPITPLDRWELRMGSGEPYLAWTHQEKMPVYSPAAVAAMVEHRERELLALLREARAMCEDGDGLIDSERLAARIDALLAKERT